MNRLLIHSVLATLVLTAVVQCGCRAPLYDPAAPRSTGTDGADGPRSSRARVQSHPGRGFYPLALGNHWTYERRFEIRIIPIDDAGEPLTGETRDVFEGTVERRLTGSEALFDRDYRVESLVLYVAGDPDTVREWRRYRQDRAGLYLADVSLHQPPAGSPPGSGVRVNGAGRGALHPGIPRWDRIAHLFETMPSSAARDGWRRHADRIRRVRALLAPGALPTGPPGGPNAEEIVLLQYPLHPAAAYAIRSEPFHVDSVVEALEVIDLPAGRFVGYRIRIENELLDPDDQVYVWRGRCGELGSSIHVETLAMDVETGEVVRIITEETDWLSGLDLNEPGRCRSGEN
ncbi:MAG: hypothetical protein P8181_11805 [bacterium]